MHVLERCMHTIPSERNGCVAREIQWFLETGGEDTPRVVDEYFGDRLPSLADAEPEARPAPAPVAVQPWV